MVARPFKGYIRPDGTNVLSYIFKTSLLPAQHDLEITVVVCVSPDCIYTKITQRSSKRFIVFPVSFFKPLFF